MEKVYDIAGIGIGPFNLGLAALTEPIAALETVFLDQGTGFNWHPGMMLDFAIMQVPFYADLVTGADPCSRFSFLNYLKQENRIYPFAIREQYYISRYEYNLYCQWVAAKLTNLRFGSQVTSLEYSRRQKHYKVVYRNGRQHNSVCAKKLVIATGTIPSLPGCIELAASNRLFHSAEYVSRRKVIDKTQTITVIGSGQSAAEIVYDLLQDAECVAAGIHWYSRSHRFFPMDISRFSCELSSPDYIDHFYSLSTQKKQSIAAHHGSLHKGINQDLLSAIYSRLYELKLLNKSKVRIAANCELQSVKETKKGRFLLSFYHHEKDKQIGDYCGTLILATGYRQCLPAFTEGIADRLVFENDSHHVFRNYSIDKKQSEVYVQNAESHTHSFSAADLGLGPYRNSVIINQVLGYEYYKVEKSIAFQTFSPD